ncbi:hypothetical protein FBU30_004970 [Linnemannia zychae]|nr:hypothetical protein FBU30_004970 [Linnemannia zychae]
MSTSRPSRTAKRNAGDKIRGQMNLLLQLAKNRGYTDITEEDNEETRSIQQGQKRRLAEDTSDIEHNIYAATAVVKSGGKGVSKKQKAKKNHSTNFRSETTATSSRSKNSRASGSIIINENGSNSINSHAQGQPSGEDDDDGIELVVVSKQIDKDQSSTSESDIDQDDSSESEYQLDSDSELNEDNYSNRDSSMSPKIHGGTSDQDRDSSIFPLTPLDTVNQNSSQGDDGPSNEIQKTQQAKDAKTEHLRIRDQRKNERLEAKAAKMKAKAAKLKAKADKRKAKEDRIAKKKDSIVRSYLTTPSSVRLAQVAQSLALQEQEENMDIQHQEGNLHKQIQVKSIGAKTEGLDVVLRVLKRNEGDILYRWPIREELLQTIPESSHIDTSNPKEPFEEHGLEFVEELTGVPKAESDYSDTDSDIDHENINVDQREPNSKQHEQQDDQDELNSKHHGQQDDQSELHSKRYEQQDTEDDLSTEETEAEKFLRAKRFNNNWRLRDSKRKHSHVVGAVHRQEVAQRSQHQRHEDERFANSRLERIQEYFDGEIARFAQIQFQEGIRAQTHDSEGTHFYTVDQNDDLTKIQQRAVSFSAEDTLRKTLDRMAYVVRQGSLLRMPNHTIDKAKGIGYERGWDTIMTSATLAGVDDRFVY